MKRDDFMKLVATGAITPLITSTAAGKKSNSTNQYGSNGSVSYFDEILVNMY